MLLIHHDRGGRPAPAVRAIPTMASSFRNWVVVVSAALFVGFTGLFWALTGSLLAAVGIAGFATVWGGVGFGVMAAGAAQAMRDERAARPARTATTPSRGERRLVPRRLSTKESS